MGEVCKRRKAKAATRDGKKKAKCAKGEQPRVKQDFFLHIFCKMLLVEVAVGLNGDAE